MVARKIQNRLRRKGRGTVFTPKDLLDLGSRAAVDQALGRLARNGFVRRLRFGVYDFPRKSRRLGVLSPSPDAVARAVARKNGSRLQVSGARAANMLGLSNQVPAHLVFLTDGPSRRVSVGKLVIEFRHVSPRRLVGAGKLTGAVLGALEYLGPGNVDDVVVKKVAGTLSARDRATLLRDAASAPDWVRPVVSKIVQQS